MEPQGPTAWAVWLGANTAPRLAEERGIDIEEARRLLRAAKDAEEIIRVGSKMLDGVRIAVYGLPLPDMPPPPPRALPWARRSATVADLYDQEPSCV